MSFLDEVTYNIKPGQKVPDTVEDDDVVNIGEKKKDHDGDGDINYNQLNRTNEEREDDDWMDDFLNYLPRARTAHAATLVGNDLVIHGGMSQGVDEWGRTTKWETLDDMVSRNQGYFLSEIRMQLTDALTCTLLSPVDF